MRVLLWLRLLSRLNWSTFAAKLAGLGAIQPHEGLALLLSTLNACGSALTTAPVLAASPLLWRTLCRLQPSPLFTEFAAPASNELSYQSAAASLPQPRLPHSASVGAATPAAVVAAAEELAAQVEARVLAVVAGVLGTSVDPQASLMEVRSPPMALGCRRSVFTVV